VSIRVQQEVFDPWRLLAAYESGQVARLGAKVGASAVFVGSMRDFNQDASVTAMTLEHYPGMTEAYLEKISAEARQRWPIQDSLIVHRYGPIVPGEPIVLVAAWAGHRDAAFAACRYLIDELKHRAPFWKQEQTSAGVRWVEQEKG